MVMGTITETTARPPTPAAPLDPIETIVVVGLTASVLAPAVSTKTLVKNQDEADAFGAFADGTLPQALKSIFDEVPNMNVVAIRADDGTNLSVVDAFDLVDEVEGDLQVRPTRITTGEVSWNLSGTDIDNTAANDVVAKMESVANQLRILAFANAPDGTIAEATGWAAINPSSRVAGVYPHVYLPGQAAAIPAGPLAAAVTAKRNRERGYWTNPNGAEVNAISRLTKPVRFDIFDATAASQVLTSANLLTIVRFLTGWTLYGNRLMQAANSTDKKRFISRRQTFDQMRLYLRTAVFLAISAQVGAQFFDDVTSYVNERIDALIRRKAIDSGSCYPDRLLNTPSALEDGDVSFVVEIDGVSDVVTVNFKLLEV